MTRNALRSLLFPYACLATLSLAGCSGSDKPAEPTCSDGTKNGSETDVDCGGSCTACALEKACSVAADCDSQVCGSTGKCAECADASTCPGQDTACATRTCTDGVCGFDYVPDGTAVATQTDGDCSVTQCDGAGATKAVNQDTDVPDDGDPCTTDTCSGGQASHVPVAAGTSCGNGLVCDSQGQCVGCYDASQCPVPSGECQVAACKTGGICGVGFLPADTVVATQTAHDCKIRVCDANGHVTTKPDDGDIKDDGQECTVDSCVDGVPTFTPKTEGTRCNNNTEYCTAGGACEQCVDASTCAEATEDCHQKACIGFVCTTEPRTAGTLADTQTAGDCTVNKCQADGSYAAEADTNDLPDDGNECTTDSCTGMTKTFTPVTAHTSCNGGAGVCNGATVDPACVGCVDVTDCHDGECSTAACNPGTHTCEQTYFAAGDLARTQVEGNCHTAHCTAEHTVSNDIDGNDVHDDGNPCTDDKCSADGVPTNDPLPVGTTCPEGQCLAGGVCGCNDVAQCPPAESPMSTLCATAVCNTTCGFDFESDGYVPPTADQTTGDCKQNECNATGELVSRTLGSDVLVDGNPCTQDLCNGQVPANPPEPAGTACNSGDVCDGLSHCIATPVAPVQGDLLITEVMYDPAADGFEWIEILNVSGASLDLAGLTVTESGTATSATPTSPIYVAAGYRLVLGHGSAPWVDYDYSAEAAPLTLPASGDLVVKVGAVEITSLTYAFTGTQGTAKQLSSVMEYPTGSQEMWYWCDASATLGSSFGTPGTANGDCGLTVTPPFSCKLRTGTVADVTGIDVPLYSHFSEQGVTDLNTAGNDWYPYLAMEVGVGTGTDGTQFTWSPAASSASYSSTTPGFVATEDESVGHVVFAAAGTYAFGFRYRPLDTAGQPTGADWTYCGQTGPVTDATNSGDWGVATVTTTQAQLVAAVGTADGTGLSLPVQGVLVTYVRATTVGSDNAGFFVQADPAGPGLFVQGAIPTLTPALAAGDQVSFTINTLATTGGIKMATAIAGLARLSRGNSLTALVQDVTGTTDLVSALNNYTSELIHVTGVLTNAPGYAGTGFLKFGLATTGIPTGTLPSFRGTPTLLDDLDLVTGCTVTVDAVPLWRNSADAQVTAWKNQDVTSVTGCPAANVGGVQATAVRTIVVSFDRHVAPASVTGGSQFTLDGGLVASTAVVSGRTITLTTTTDMVPETTYHVDVPASVTDTYGTPVVPGSYAFKGFGSCSLPLVISQVYGGSGASGAYKYDFVELHNRGPVPAPLYGWSIQYASSAGSSWAANALSGTIPAGGFFLIHFSSPGSAGSVITADLTLPTTSSNFSGTTGKIALVHANLALPGVTCPSDPSIVDFVGYGTGANCTEGGSGTAPLPTAAPAPSTANSIFRNSTTDAATLACQDAGNNASDFTAAAVAPRNGSTTAVVCACQ